MLLDLIKKYGMIIFVLGIIVVFMLFSRPQMNHLNHSLPAENNVDELTFGLNQDIITSTVIVDVKGEVNQPGVYEVDHDARIHEVILLAGGFTDEADEFPVNLAQKVYDEMTIIVPKVGEASMNIGNQSGDGKVRINFATEEEIESLPGIGPAKAQAIIQYREEHGHFKQIEDLLNVSGIGEKTLENMKDDIQIP